VTGRLRITGGRLVRRLIEVPPAAGKGGLRPTSDKVRQALFASLQSRFDLDGRAVVDVCCGSGALGFEAVSRGAASCVFVDHHKGTIAVVDDNARALGVDDVCVGAVDDAVRFLVAAGPRFDLVLLDPPYARVVDEGLARAVAGACRPGAVVVVERSARSPDLRIDGLSLVDERRYGDTRVDVFVRDAGVDDVSTASSGAAIYPGSFDPLTNGHVDIIKRGLTMFDRVIVAVANNPQKTHFFNADERIALARQSIGDLKGLELEAFDGLIVDFAKKKSVNILLRGVRAVSDFEYEFQLAGMNRKLSGVETVFMVTSEDSFYVASRMVKEVASFGGDVSSMVPAPVLAALTQRYAEKQKQAAQAQQQQQQQQQKAK
jgi:pantetheine-phosphate adenylyltransferase